VEKLRKKDRKWAIAALAALNVVNLVVVANNATRPR